MHEQPRPSGPEAGHGTGETGKNRPEEFPADQTAKQRGAYLDPRGSEGTRELRDTARRRRDAEEKLQQHLMEAKEHVPNEFHEQHATGHGGGPAYGDGHGHGAAHPATAGPDGPGHDAGEAGDEPPEDPGREP